MSAVAPTIIVKQPDHSCNAAESEGFGGGVLDFADLLRAPLGTVADAVIVRLGDTRIVIETAAELEPFDLDAIERRVAEREQWLEEEREREREQRRYEEWLAAGLPSRVARPDLAGEWCDWNWESMGGSCTAGRSALLRGVEQ